MEIATSRGTEQQFRPAVVGHSSCSLRLLRVLLFQPAPVIPEVRWTTTAAQLASANATQILQGTPATSAPWASTATPAAHVSSHPCERILGEGGEELLLLTLKWFSFP